MIKNISHQRGQAIVLFAFAILGMIAMVALAIDSANAYSGRRKAQTSSDNAALAAALKLTDGADDPTLLAEALNITRENGFSDADVTFHAREYARLRAALEDAKAMKWRTPADATVALQQVLRAQLRRAGDVSALIETPGGFLLYVARAKTSETLSVTAFALPKRSYEAWLAEQTGGQEK